jgi:hypothetical protein
VVRIIIETEEKTTVRPQEEAPTSPQEQPTVPATTGEPTPPAEVLAAAAAIGARDAGPAPTGPPAGTVSGAPALPVVTSPGAPVAGSEDLAAGAAPGTSLEPPPTVVSEDSE